jgi:tetratricopeptide (TPR) repeat protein
MDGRACALVLLALTLGSGGCVTTTEKKVFFRTEGEAPPVTTAPKDEPKKPAPPGVVIAFAAMKEREADAVKSDPEAQARLRDEARRGYQDVLKHEPNNHEAIRGLARIYTRMADFDRAREVYTKALAKSPRDPELWHDLGMMYNRKKDWGEGIRCFQKGLEADPENQRCLKALGFTLARLGQAEQSVQYLTRAMGSVAVANYNVALMLLHLGEQELAAQRPALEEVARQHLRAAMQADPNYEPAREALAALQGTPGSPARGAAAIQFANPAQ